MLMPRSLARKASARLPVNSPLALADEAHFDSRRCRSRPISERRPDIAEGGLALPLLANTAIEATEGAQQLAFPETAQA